MKEILCADHAYRFLKQRIRFDVEEVWVMALNSKKMIIRSSCIFRGTVDRCYIHPRDIFRFICISNASSYILSHSHPSNDSIPSLADIEETKKMLKLSGLIQIPMEDHIICCSDQYFSFAEETKWFIN